jgi:hypothetical protein
VESWLNNREVGSLCSFLGVPLKRHRGEFGGQAAENTAHQLHLFLARKAHAWKERKISRIITTQKI